MRPLGTIEDYELTMLYQRPSAPCVNIRILLAATATAAPAEPLSIFPVETFGKTFRDVAVPLTTTICTDPVNVGSVKLSPELATVATTFIPRVRTALLASVPLAVAVRVSTRAMRRM